MIYSFPHSVWWSPQCWNSQLNGSAKHSLVKYLKSHIPTFSEEHLPTFFICLLAGQSFEAQRQRSASIEARAMKFLHVSFLQGIGGEMWWKSPFRQFWDLFGWFFFTTFNHQKSDDEIWKSATATSDDSKIWRSRGLWRCRRTVQVVRGVVSWWAKPLSMPANR